MSGTGNRRHIQCCRSFCRYSEKETACCIIHSIWPILSFMKCGIAEQMQYHRSFSARKLSGLRGIPIKNRDKTALILHLFCFIKIYMNNVG
jgi:hypothetical protein